MPCLLPVAVRFQSLEDFGHVRGKSGNFSDLKATLLARDCT